MSELIEPSESRTQEELDREVRRIMARKSRRAFLIGGAAAVAGYGGYHWLYNAAPVDELQGPLRKAEEWNALLSRALFGERPLAPTYSLSKATPLRVNGDIGISPDLILDTWRLQVVGLEMPQSYKQFTDDVDLWTYKSSEDAPDPLDQEPLQQDSVKISAGPVTPVGSDSSAEGLEKVPGILLTMVDIQKLPYVEMVTQFKCIEGWSQIAHWGGARFSDFMKAYPPELNSDGSVPKYAAMETPEGDFFSGYDIQSLMHPQTLLCYSMGGRPLAPEHGAPLRLAMPLKYGYKQIKQIAKITYTNQRPPDYWAKVGYDWYGGL